MDESPTPVSDLLLHPIRWRIVQRVLGRELTTTELKRDLPDVPTTSLYRQVAVLIDAGFLTVVRERRVRGTTERTLTLDQTKVGYSQLALYVDAADLETVREGINAVVAPHLQEVAGKDRVVLSLIALPDV